MSARERNLPWPDKQKITTYLWFADQAEEAAKFYTSLFKNSRSSRSPATPTAARIPVPS